MPVLLTLSPTTTLHTKTKICTYRQLTAARTAAEEKVGPCRKGSMPPAHGRRTEGGEVPDIVVSDAALTLVAAEPTPPRETGDCEDNGDDHHHHGQSPPPALPSAEPRHRVDDRAGGGSQPHQRQRGRRRRQQWGRRRRLPPSRLVLA